MTPKEAYHPDATRSEILQAAFKEIYIHGFQAASLGRILANVNHTKGALYHHFSNKKKLGLSVINEMIGQRVYSIFMKPLESSTDPIPVLCTILQQKIETLTPEEIRFGCPLNNLTQEMSSIDEDFYNILTELTNKWIKVISDAFARGQENGNIRADADCEGSATMIVATIEGTFGLGKTSKSPFFFAKSMTQLQFFIRSLG